MLTICLTGSRAPSRPTRTADAAMISGSSSRPSGSPPAFPTPRRNLLGNHVEAEVGVAFFVAAYSALRKAPVAPALLVLGDMSVQGNIKPMRSLVEPLQVARDNGAKRALIPIENKRNFLDVPADVVEYVDPIFYGDLKTAAMKVLGLT
jgi:ATP-dependent Lon protease